MLKYSLKSFPKSVCVSSLIMCYASILHSVEFQFFNVELRKNCIADCNVGLKLSLNLLCLIDEFSLSNMYKHIRQYYIDLP